MKSPRRAGWLAAALTLVLGGATACGSTGSTGSGGGSSDDLMVSPQDGTPPAGFNRIGIALFRKDAAHPDKQTPVLGASVSYELQRRGGAPLERHQLSYIGGGLYRDIPVYLGVGSFPGGGEFELVVTARMPDGSEHHGHAFVNAVTNSPELPVGHSLREIRGSLRQRVAADVGGDLTQIDSGIANGRPAPDPFHDATVADGLAQHRPMLLYFGQPGHCVSEVCGPTIAVIEQLAREEQGRLLIEHIEVNDPASSTAFNPVFVAFGLQSEPQTYFVNAQGVVADKYVGPVSLEQLRQSAAGTLAGRMPAVPLTG